MIHIDDVAKVEIKIGKILSAEPIEGSEKLLKLSVDFGIKPSAQDAGAPAPESVVEQRDVRTILSGIAKYYKDGVGLAGIKCAFITNLEPRPMMGMESHGMILATSGKKDGEDFFSPLLVPDNIPEGSVIH